MATECPSLTTLTPDTILLTQSNVFELQVSTWNRTVGTVVKVTCQTGLVLQGKDTVTCLATGEWDVSPLPKCIDPPPTTTSSPGVDTGLVLMIVLICAMVVVTIVMIILCAALYHSSMTRKKTNISTKIHKDNEHMYTQNDHHNQTQTYYPSPPRRHTANRPYRIQKPNLPNAEDRESMEALSNRNNRTSVPHAMQRRDQEYTITYVPIKAERVDTERNPASKVTDSNEHPAVPYKKDPNKNIRPNKYQKASSAHAPRTKGTIDPGDRRSFSDITAYYGGLFYDDTSDTEEEFYKRKIVKRDYFLWRDMPASWSHLQIPRPQYKS